LPVFLHKALDLGLGETETIPVNPKGIKQIPEGTILDLLPDPDWSCRSVGAWVIQIPVPEIQVDVAEDISGLSQGLGAVGRIKKQGLIGEKTEKFVFSEYHDKILSITKYLPLTWQ